MCSPSRREIATNTKCEESGYDSDTRKSAETVSPKSSDKSDESDSADTSGSFSSDIKDCSDTDPETEPHYQVTLQFDNNNNKLISGRFPGTDLLPPRSPRGGASSRTEVRRLPGARASPGPGRGPPQPPTSAQLSHSARKTSR